MTTKHITTFIPLILMLWNGAVLGLERAEPNKPIAFAEPSPTERVEDALKRSLGVSSPVTVEAAFYRDEAYWYAIVTAGTRAEVLLSEDTASPELLDVRFGEVSQVLNPWLKKFFELHLSRHLPGEAAEVFAYGSHPQEKDGVYRWHLWASLGNGSEPQMFQMAFTGSSVRLEPYTYNEAAFRKLAGHLGTQASLDICTSFEAPLNRLGALEVLLKSQKLVPEAYSFVTFEDSPIGYDTDREIQILLPALVGDNAIYVTIEKANGRIRAELFN